MKRLIINKRGKPILISTREDILVTLIIGQLVLEDKISIEIFLSLLDIIYYSYILCMYIVWW
jgi:hypothetical protein